MSLYVLLSEFSQSLPSVSPKTVSCLPKKRCEINTFFTHIPSMSHMSSHTHKDTMGTMKRHCSIWFDIMMQYITAHSYIFINEYKQ